MLKKLTLEDNKDVKERKAKFHPFPEPVWDCLVGCADRCDFSKAPEDSAYCNGNVCMRIS